MRTSQAYRGFDAYSRLTGREGQLILLIIVGIVHELFSRDEPKLDGIERIAISSYIPSSGVAVRDRTKHNGIRRVENGRQPTFLERSMENRHDLNTSRELHRSKQ